MKRIKTITKSRSSQENTSTKEYEFAKPRSLVIQISQALRDAISRNELVPGQILVETELQKWFGVSRAPIREAIRLLEAENLVVVDGYKQKYVRRVTYEYLSKLIPVNSCLEACAAGIAVKLITNKQVEYLKKTNKNMKHAYDNEEYDKCNEINFKFHRAFIRIANNEILRKTISTLDRGGVTRLWLTSYYFSNKKLILKSINEHQKIIRGFVRRDVFGVQNAVRDHVTNALNLLLKNSNFDSEGNIIFGKTEK